MKDPHEQNFKVLKNFLLIEDAQPEIINTNFIVRVERKSDVEATLHLSNGTSRNVKGGMKYIFAELCKQT